MKNFRSYINIIVGVCVFVAFLLLNLVSIEFAPQPFLDVLLYSGLMFVCWVLIKNAFAEQGILSGQKDRNVIITKKEHLNTSIEITNHKKSFVEWCAERNKERLKQARIAILTKTSLLYEDYFDEDGNFLDKQVPEPNLVGNKKLDKIRRKEYKRACKLLNKAQDIFVAPYVPDEILEREKIGNARQLFGLTIKQWKNIKLFSSILVSIILCVMLAFVKTSGKTLSQDETFILIFQLLIMGGSALSFYFSSYNFICTDWRNAIILKVRIMDEFYRAKVGVISYEADKKLEDGSIILGRKIFTANNKVKSIEGDGIWQKETSVI